MLRYLGCAVAAVGLTAGGAGAGGRAPGRRGAGGGWGGRGRGGALGGGGGARGGGAGRGAGGGGAGGGAGGGERGCQGSERAGGSLGWRRRQVAEVSLERSNWCAEHGRRARRQGCDSAQRSLDRPKRPLLPHLGCPHRRP